MRISDWSSDVCSSGLGTMNQLLSRNGDHLPLGPAVFHARLRAQDAYVEPDQTRALPAVPAQTGGTTPLFLASASRLAGPRALPPPPHPNSRDVEWTTKSTTERTVGRKSDA